ncbi:hypothetical protein BGZ98_004789 [Dissophora globulifera]|nr:hypothetical protein BGZ98_004789 [Dissophora globulifera]
MPRPGRFVPFCEKNSSIFSIVSTTAFTQKKAFALKDSLRLESLNNEDDESLVRHHNTKKQQPQPRPKKKTSSISELMSARPLQQHSSTVTSLGKQPPTVLQTKLMRQENQENQSQTLSNNSSGKSKDDDKSSKNNTGKASRSMSTEQLTAALEDLNVKYKRLKQLRVTEAEKNLEECRGKLEEATRSAENYRAQMEPQLESALRTQEKLRDNSEIMNAKVRTLQRQVRDYEEKARQREQEDRAKAKTASMEAILASPDVTPSSAANASTIKMFENLSGFTILPRDIFPRSSKDKLPTIWDCEHTGPRGTLHFTLKYDYDNNLVTYTPSLDLKRDAKLLESLPEYLIDEIEFERQFESKFFWRILNFNNDDS